MIILFFYRSVTLFGGRRVDKGLEKEKGIKIP